jgi:anion-transporting  ArsA/GET3 family ATPase
VSHRPAGLRLGHRRLVIIGGKGGVGRSTVAAALGLAAAQQGRRTLLVELAGRSDVARLLGGQAQPGLAETELGPSLHHVTVERQATLRDYLDHEVPGPLPAGRLARSRTFSMFIDATPGMGELLMIGKVAELARTPRGRRGARPYDLVVLDGPASGQLLALLRAPRTFGSIARVGPVAHQTAAIDALLTSHRQTTALLVSTPEQMAISEAVGLWDTLDAGGTAVGGVVVNRTVSSRFSAQDEARLEAAADDPAVRSARWFCDRARAQRQQISRLRRELPGVPQVRLPMLFGGAEGEGLRELTRRLAGHV